MTREEAIEYNQNLKMYMKVSDKNQPCKFLEENYIALDMAIKALEQESVLDKIRAEIERKCNRINSLASVLSYTAHREIQELLCDIMNLCKAESEE